MVKRGTTNRNDRGNSSARRSRRQWLLDQFGNGKRAKCSLQISSKCLRVVDIDTISVDRIIPGIEGGTYRRDNIRPACVECNSLQGGMMSQQRRKK